VDSPTPWDSSELPMRIARSECWYSHGSVSRKDGPVVDCNNGTKERENGGSVEDCGKISAPKDEAAGTDRMKGASLQAR
jgi:hypothetical protein